MTASRTRARVDSVTMRPILVAIDQTPMDSQAVDAALAIAGSGRPRIVLVHAVPPPTPASRAEVFGASANLHRAGLDRERRARSALSRHEVRICRRGVEVTTAIVEAPAADALLRAARRFDAAFIVFSGRAGGSGLDPESLRLLRLAPCPVLFVRRTAVTRADPSSLEPAAANPPLGERATRPLLRAPTPRRATSRPPKRK